MAVSLVSGYAIVSATNGTLPLPVGSNYEAGDLRIVACTCSADRSFSAETSGWSILYSGSGQTVSRHLTLFAKVLGESESDGVARKSGDYSGYGLSGVTLRGWDPDQTLSPTFTGSNSSSRNSVAPSIQTGKGALVTFHDVTRLDQTANQGTLNAPSGMTLLAGSLSDNPMGYNVIIAGQQVSGGMSGTKTAVFPSAGVWSAGSLFIAEALGIPPGRFLIAS